MKKEVWGGLSDDDKKELSNLAILNEIYNRTISSGMVSDWFGYMTGQLDGDEFIDLLKKFNVRFAKEEEDLILDEDNGCDNIDDIANYICDEISKNESNLVVDENRIAEMDEEDLEAFLDNFDSNDLANILKELFDKRPNMKTDFIKLCVKKYQESNNN